ncbi:Aste57867_16456 [Aphanomyces stellatus]|uniref:Aste57867_16456 protein n=1 Tax=Aphanomyces stellatus TaxID=120398 RepID=A0A485L6G8_9STRA|nr:hypothetical protein As57867_016399 [Aphanomyces stellatus]VFT93230.1 Aste57867_16456 [Aphanomyces stellatus]
MSDSSEAPPSTSLDAKRKYECERKRRYRAKLRAQRDTSDHAAPLPLTKSHKRRQIRLYRAVQRESHRSILIEVAYLEDQLQQRRDLHVALDETTAWWRDAAVQALGARHTSATNNQSLREQVKRQQILLRLLHHWVSASIEPGLCDRRTWLHSTLVADPVARAYGYQWHTDRVYHHALSWHAADGHVADFMKAGTFTRIDDDTGDDTIMGMYTQYQTTLMASLDDVAACVWDDVMQDPHPNHLTTHVEATDSMVYKYVHAARQGTSSCLLVRRYDASERVVLATAMVETDACAPLAADTLRPHGHAYVVLEKIASDVTLYRSVLVQFAPVTTTGPITLAQTAAIFGVDVVHPPTTPAVTIARIDSAMQHGFLHAMHGRQADLNNRLTRHQPRVG